MTAGDAPGPVAGTESPDIGSEIEIVADVRTSTSPGAEGGIRLPPGLAADLRELAGKQALEGARRLLAGDRSLTMVLDPSKDTRKKLKTGELVLTQAKDKSGRVLAQARDAKTGQVAEHIKLKPAAGANVAKTGTKAAVAGAAAAWQVAAIATQQHYLVEISGRLSGIEVGVSDIVRRQLVEKASALKTTEEDLRHMQDHIDSGVQLDINDRQNVETWYKQARATRIEALELARATLEDPERDPADALPDLMLADHAMRTALLCASTLLRLPCEDERRRLNDFWHYAVQAEEGLADVNELVVALEERRLHLAMALHMHEATQPPELHRKVWNQTLGRFVAYQGARKPELTGLAELPTAEKEWLKARSNAAALRPDAVPATVELRGETAMLMPPGL